MKEKYYSLLYEYILKETPLKKFDDYLSESELNFRVLKEVFREGEFQKRGLRYLKYFFLRNYLHFENLSEEEMKTLEAIDDETPYEVRKEFVEQTYKAVITARLGGPVCGVPYGPLTSLNYFAPDGAFVIGFIYDEYYGTLDIVDKKADDEWADNNDAQSDELYEFFPKVTEEMKEALGIPVKVIKYESPLHE